MVHGNSIVLITTIADCRSCQPWPVWLHPPCNAICYCYGIFPQGVHQANKWPSGCATSHKTQPYCPQLPPTRSTILEPQALHQQVTDQQPGESNDAIPSGSKRNASGKSTCRHQRRLEFTTKTVTNCQQRRSGNHQQMCKPKKPIAPKTKVTVMERFMAHRLSRCKESMM